MSGRNLGDLNVGGRPPTLGDQAEAFARLMWHVGEVVWFAKALALGQLDLSTAIVELGYHARQAERAAEDGRLV